MLEYNFRAWDRVKKVMHYPTDLNIFRFNDKGWALHHYKDVLNVRDEDRFICNHKNADLMQYIGMTDNNYNKIYKGDILKYQHYFSKKYHFVKVVWMELECTYGFQDLKEENYLIPTEDWDYKYFEVVGNIYENPDIKG